MGDGILICVACAATVLVRTTCASVVLPQPGSVLMSVVRVTTEAIQMWVIRQQPEALLMSLGLATARGPY